MTSYSKNNHKNCQKFIKNEVTNVIKSVKFSKKCQEMSNAGYKIDKKNTGNRVNQFRLKVHKLLSLGVQQTGIFTSYIIKS